MKGTKWHKNHVCLCIIFEDYITISSASLPYWSPLRCSHDWRHFCLLRWWVETGGRSSALEKQTQFQKITLFPETLRASIIYPSTQPMLIHQIRASFKKSQVFCIGCISWFNVESLESLSGRWGLIGEYGWEMIVTGVCYDSRHLSTNTTDWNIFKSRNNEQKIKDYALL